MLTVNKFFHSGEWTITIPGVYYFSVIVRRYSAVGMHCFRMKKFTAATSSVVRFIFIISMPINADP